MKNLPKGSVAVILLVIVIVILLGVVGSSYLKPTKPQVSEANPQVVNTSPELLKYSGKTDTGVSFSIKYPSSWTYYKFSCNADGMAFWPKASAPDFSKGTGGSCSTNFIDGAPIIVHSTGNQPSININNSSYQSVYNQMKGSLFY